MSGEGWGGWAQWGMDGGSIKLGEGCASAWMDGGERPVRDCSLFSPPFPLSFKLTFQSALEPALKPDWCMCGRRFSRPRLSPSSSASCVRARARVRVLVCMRDGALQVATLKEQLLARLPAVHQASPHLLSLRPSFLRALWSLPTRSCLVARGRISTPCMERRALFTAIVSCGRL